MLGSQIIDANLTFSGRDFGANEVHAFGYCSFEKAVSTSDNWTSHPGPEVVIVLRGEACWDCGPDIIVRAKGGQAIFFPGGIEHRIADGIYPPCETLWFAVNQLGQSPPPTLLTDDEAPEFYDALPRVPTMRQLPPELMHDASQFTRALQGPGARSGSRLVMSELRAKLYSLMVDVWRACETHDARDRVSRMVLDAASILSLRVDENVSIGDVADELGYSRGYLHSAFRREMGMSPSDYQRRLRLRLCCDRLVQSRDSVTEIAHSLGFSSSQHLAKVFRSYHGVTPSDYRRQHQGASA